MSFLGLPFLFALPLIAIPVVIHLYRGRQRDVINWGAMQFLAEATTKGRSIQRLEELLLMVLRVSAVLALILALARPMMRSNLLSASVDREIVLLLDNSLSMDRAVNNMSAGDLAADRAMELLNEFDAGDTVHLMLASGGGQWLTAEGLPGDSLGKRQLNSLIEGVEPTLGKASLLDCLQIAINAEPQGNPSSRHIYVFTDDQAANWQIDAERQWEQLGSVRQNAPIPTAVEVISCALEAETVENLAVTKLEASRQLVRPEDRVEFVARITNGGDSASEATTVKWRIDDEVFESSDLRSLAPGETTQLAASTTRRDTGTLAVSCMIDAEDQISLDNRGTTVIEVSEELPVLVVHDRQAETTRKTADELFTAALGYDGETPSRWHSVYRPTVVSVDDLSDITLAQYRAVVALSLTELTEDAHRSLHDYVRAGGGLWIALGDLVDRDSYNRFWYDDGGGLSPTSLETLITVRDTNTPAGVIHPPERDHPATEQLSNTTQLDIDQARLTDYWQLVSSADEDRQAWVLLESGDGSPLVVENFFGDGRVLVQAFPLGLQWSNLPQLKSYVVMIHDWLDYLTAPAMARYNLQPGAAIASPLPAGADLTTAKLLLPGGKEIELSTSGGDESGLVRYSQTQLPGLYTLRLESNGNFRQLPFYVMRDGQESKLRPLASDQQTKLRELAGLQFDDAPVEITSAVTNIDPRPKAEPIWGVLLAGLVALLIGEQMLSNWLTRQRSGVAVST
ncbi:MAG: BatA domain-containing protein [Planctomycetota bacterium]